MSRLAVSLAFAVVLGWPPISVATPNPFTEEAELRGLDYSLPFYLPNGAIGSGFGLALADLDNDGDADAVAVGQVGGRVGLWENDGTGHFIDRNAGSGLPLISNLASSATLADFDADGLLDLTLVQKGGGPTLLMKNLGGFQFQDVTPGSGVMNTWTGESASWGDYNGDGWLDLYLVNYCNPFNLCATGFNKLYENQGDGTFIDVAAALGVDDKGAGLHGQFYDFDRDGDADLYLSNDRGHVFLMLHNRLWENVGGQFIEITDSSGTGFAAYSMGVGIGDFDGNGWDDIYCTNIGPSAMYFNQGGNVFIEDAVGAGVDNDPSAGWAAQFIDFDNDADLDLYVCNTGNTPGGNKLYENIGSFPAPEVQFEYNAALLSFSHAQAFADIDLDGDLDFLVNAMLSPLLLLINHEGETRNWLRVQVRGKHPNLFAVGAMVDVRIGKTWQHREIQTCSNYKSTNEYPAHFGMNDAAMADEVVVTWPGGLSVNLGAVPVNQTIEVVPPNVADLTNDGVVNGADLGQLLLFWTDEVDSVTAAADLNYDRQVDGADLGLMLLSWTVPLR
jgi:hypothetical protein